MTEPMRIKVCVAHRFVREGLSALLDADDRFTLVSDDCDDFDVAVLDDVRSGTTARRLFLLDRSARRVDGQDGPREHPGVADLVGLLRGDAPRPGTPENPDGGRNPVLNERE